MTFPNKFVQSEVDTITGKEQIIMNIQGQEVDIITTIDPELYGKNIIFKMKRKCYMYRYKNKFMGFFYQQFYYTRSLGKIWKAPDTNQTYLSK